MADDILDGLPEYSGKLLQLLFDKQALPEQGVFTRNLEYHLFQLSQSLFDLRRQYIKNLAFTESHERDDIAKTQFSIDVINGLTYPTFIKFVNILVNLNYQPEKLIETFNERLKDLNFECFASEQNLIFSLVAYSKHQINYEGLFFHKAFKNYKISLPLEGGSKPKKPKKANSALLGYSPEYIATFDNILLGVLQQIFDLNPNHSTEGILNLGISLFIFYNLCNIDEEYLCEHYKLNK